MIRIGPAGWSYRDWEGTVYPPHGRSFDPLAYLSSYFDTIEINSSFYRIPPTQHGKSWVRRVDGNRSFMFTAKLYRGFTHDQFSDQDVTEFKRFLDSLAEAERLGALLMQFPWSFHGARDASETKARLEKLFDLFSNYPCVIEVRHGSFDRSDFFEFLDAHAVSFANIDQPIVGDSLGRTRVTTGPLSYVRLHGRNYEKWFDHEQAWERYNYLYSPQELAPWVEAIEEMGTRGDVYVVTNNHFRGQAITNALELKIALGEKPAIPERIAATYPGRFEG